MEEIVYPVENAVLQLEFKLVCIEILRRRKLLIDRTLLAACSLSTITVQLSKVELLIERGIIFKIFLAGLVWMNSDAADSMLHNFFTVIDSLFNCDI